MTTERKDTEHGISLASARRKGWAVCICGWSGPKRNDPVFASRDGADHIREVSIPRSDDHDG